MYDRVINFWFILRQVLSVFLFTILHGFIEKCTAFLPELQSIPWILSTIILYTIWRFGDSSINNEMIGFYGIQTTSSILSFPIVLSNLYVYLIVELGKGGCGWPLSSLVEYKILYLPPPPKSNVNLWTYPLKKG